MLRAKKHPSRKLVKTWLVCGAREKKELLYASENEHLAGGAAALSYAAYGDRLAEQIAAILPSRRHLATA
jgi:hypothetical protein